jgi:hypothetical protein
MSDVTYVSKVRIERVKGAPPSVPAHGVHQNQCPVAVTLRVAVAITTELGLEVEG